MEKQVILFLALLGGILLLIAGAVKEKLENLIDFILRGLLGMVGIHFANAFLGAFGISLGIGINFFNFLTSAFLGIPGFLGLYFLGFFHSL